MVRAICKTIDRTTTTHAKSIPSMKLSVFSVLFFAIAFLSEALPLSNIEDINLIQDSTGEELAENFMGSRPGVSKIILVADAGLLRMLTALEKKMPERILSPDRIDGSPDFGSSISIVRRDTKRCMVGRVYRPCWEV
ncbi:pro-melanin-concentrating hormone, like [Tachysurus fulvidraco]|uniref:pro-melanin-concentrating hormone, like n=1 Tax=Tachysurus fulvidraco TaxID=1234273 RepID=UPI001FEF6611|nr:pro-melanin-concentrating hormone, like [Tachysurus fulvidraco]